MPYPTGPWLRAVMHLADSESHWENVAWYVPTAAIPPTLDIQALSDAIDVAIGAAYTPVITLECTYVGTSIYLNNGTDTISAVTYSSQGGTGTVDTLPSECAAIVRLQTNVGGRTGRGRHFVGGLPEADVSGSFLSTPLVALIDVLKNVWTTNQTWESVTWKPHLFRPSVSLLTPINFGTTTRILGHQRRRRPKF